MPIRRLSLWCLLACCGLVVGCQTVEPPVATGSIGDAATNGPVNAFRERKGWRVVFAPARDGVPAHCRGRRDGGGGESGGPLSITFLGGESESGFRLDGFAADRAMPGGDEIVARFGNGQHQVYSAQLTPGPSLTVTFPTKRYEEILFPFAHSHDVELRGRKLGPLGELELDGSSWTINATDECRRMKVPPAR